LWKEGYGMSRTKRMVYLAMLVTVAMMCSYIESILMIPVGIPGVKPGLANGITIVVLFLYGKKEAGIVSFIRILLSTLLFGNVSALVFSVTGFLCSFAVMLVLKRSRLFSVISISVAGGVAHNTGQMIMAAVLMETAGLLYYIPVLIIAGMGFGIAVGIIAAILIKRLTIIGVMENR